MPRMTAAQVEAIINKTAAAKPTSYHQVGDYKDLQEQQQKEVLEGFTQAKSQTTAREGEILPPPPKNLTFEVYDPLNDPMSTDEALELEETQEEELRDDVPQMLAGIDLESIETRAQLIYNLTLNIPLNELGLPKWLFRTDMLDHTLFRGVPEPEVENKEVREEKFRELVDHLEAAKIHLGYYEGFPTFPTGEPLWARLPFEAPEQHAAFLEYCEQPGARQLARLPGYTEHSLKWFHENYWNIRVKCYDMLHAIHAAKIREQRVLLCEDNHYKEASKLYTELTNMAGSVDWAQLKEDPNQYLGALEKVIKLQRLALGQSMVGGSDRRGMRHETTESMMRPLAGANVPQHPDGDPNQAPQTPLLQGMVDEGIQVRKLLRNPGALATAQELIIRMTQVTQVHATITNDQEEGD